MSASERTPVTAEDADEQPDVKRGIGSRAVIIGVLFTIGAGLWVVQVELILHTAEISESVPLIAALAGILALVAHNRLLSALAGLAERSRHAAAGAVAAFGAICWLLSIPAGGSLATFLMAVAGLMGVVALTIAARPDAARMLGSWRVARREIILVYCFMTLGALMMSAKISGYIIPAATVSTYFALDDAHLAEAGRYTPEWLTLKNEEVVRTLYEGSNLDMPAGPGGLTGAVLRATSGLWWPLMQVPWAAWMVPLVAWTTIMALVFTAGMCMMGLMKRYWMEKERLSFPLVMIPMELASAGDRIRASAFLRDPGFWVGFVAAGSFTFFVVLHALSPALPSFQPFYNLSPLFSEHPWTSVQNASIQVRPELVGLSYFMDSDIIFTIWFMTIVNSLLAVGTSALGYETRDFPRAFDQGVGSYVILAIFIVFSARHWIVQGLHLAAGWRRSRQGRRYAALWTGLVLSVGALIAITIAAGMKPWVALYLFGIILVFFLVYGRARAETGVPHPSPFPMGGHMNVLTYIAGPRSWAGGATPGLLGAMFFLGRGYTVTAAGAEIENLKIADEEGVRERSMILLSLAAPVIGLAIAFALRLGASYHYGLNVLEGGGVEGGYPITQMRNHANQVIREASQGMGRHVPAANAAIFGALVTTVLIILRRIFLRFPLHPLGYCLSMVRLRAFWAPIMFTWIIKTLLLKIGGARAYRRAAPIFMGIAIGHYFFAGIGLGCLAAAFPRLLERTEVINFD